MKTIATDQIKGMTMVIIGAALWGVSGTVAQTLFQDHHISVDWLVDIRLLGAGLVLILLSFLGPRRKNVWRVWADPKTAFGLILFGILGLLGVQYTYLAAIAKGNAAVATLLQYLAPVFIAGYVILKRKLLPSWAEWSAIFLALLGTFLLLTNGSMENLNIPIPAIVWGVLSALSLSFYTIYPGRMLTQWGAPIIIGWGMIIGGIGLSFLHPPWKVQVADWTFETVAFISFVIIFGTLIAFYLYLESQRYISAKESSLLACTEPLTAVVTAILWLGVPMGIYQVLGAICVMAMIILLAIKPEVKKDIQYSTEQDVKTQ